MNTFITHLLDRPVGVTCFYLLLGALAVMALFRLPVALLPSLSYPALVIWTSWEDVSPERVEQSVTIPIEQAVVGVPGVRDITSRSQLGGSFVRLDFGWNSDLDFAALDVRQKLDRVAGALPDSAERPLVLRVDPSDRPILMIAMGEIGAPDPTPSQLIDLKQIGESVVARRLEQLDGVARVRVTGGYQREIQVSIDPDRMAAYGIDMLQVERALQDANLSLAGGTIQKGPFRYMVEVSGKFRSVDEVAAAVVSGQGRPSVRLTELATVREGVARRHGMVRFDGREVLLLLVERRPDANTVKTAAEARQALEDLKSELPGIGLDVVVDESVFIEAAIDGVIEALVWGGLLAVGILLFFLRRPRLLAAVALAVPLSLAIALVFFDLLHITLNLISLSGLALGVGLLVDNSIVVVENIARLREEGLSPRVAAAQGATEVAGAITASTLTTLAVFVPLTFVEGLAGRLFRDQSLAVVCSVGASLLVALTVVPLVASRDRKEAFLRLGARSSPGLAIYEQLLDRCITRPVWVVGGAFAFLLTTSALAVHLPREVIPRSDGGRVQVRFSLPPDAALSLVEARSTDLEATLADIPGVTHVLADLGERDDARLELNPRPPNEGELTVVVRQGVSSSDLAQRLNAIRWPPDLEVEARPTKTQLQSLLVPGEADLVLDLVSETREKAEASVPTLLTALRKRSELANVMRGDLQELPAYDIRFDWDAVVRLGARAEVLDSYLESAARGKEATRLHLMRSEVPVVVRSRSGSVEGLLSKRVLTKAGALPIGSFVEATQVTLPALLLRHGQAPVLRLHADLAPGTGLEEAVTAAEEELSALSASGVRVRVGGANQAFGDSLVAVAWSLLLSLVLVYLILAAQFESGWQPLLVLSVVPPAISGVALTLWFFGHSWNLMSLTACIVLIGIAVNDAIVKVDFMCQGQRRGLSRLEAARQAGHDRYRPIVMTTATTVIGLLPFALGLGVGGSLRAPLAVVLAGGLCVTTALTLVIIPTVAGIGGSISQSS